MIDSKASLFLRKAKSEADRARLMQLLAAFDQLGLNTNDEERYSVPPREGHVTFRVPLSGGNYVDIYSGGEADFRHLWNDLQSHDWNDLNHQLIELIPHPKGIKNFNGYADRMFPFRELDDVMVERFTEVLAWLSETAEPYAEPQLRDEYAEAREDELEVERRVTNKTTRKRLIDARRGQGKFRRDVIARWGKGESCVLTGVSVPELLIASHIKPWRKSDDNDRLDPMNGLLLAAHADKLFDQFLMSFQEEDGEFVSTVHPSIQEEVAQIGIRNDMKLDTSHLSEEERSRFRLFIGYHLTRHQEKSKGKP